jgi:hypothetical protein
MSDELRGKRKTHRELWSPKLHEVSVHITFLNICTPRESKKGAWYLLDDRKELAFLTFAKRIDVLGKNGWSAIQVSVDN